ncbi:hypothetical protein BDV06DRAFT_201324 [Aspergillus oleicola]
MTSVKSTTENLIVAVAKTGKDTPRFRALRRRVDDSLRSSLYGRTDQFSVAKQLDGLLEKFRVLNRDDLADALEPRLAELNEHRGSVFPEILSLLLQLADRPAQHSKVQQNDKLQPQKEEEKLIWTDLDTGGAAYADEDIWESVDYGADSSDEDDISSLSTDTPPSRSFTHAAAQDDDYVIPDDIFSSGEDEDLLTSIKSVQFWNEDKTSELPEGGKVSSRVITELQMAREVVFMLQGLPTSLLWRLDGNVVVDRRYTVSHLSKDALSSLLRSISACGTKIDILREFVKTPKTTAYIQTFHRSVEDCLHKFDEFLSYVQSRYISENSSVAISLLQLSGDVQHESRLLIFLADLVSNLDKAATNGVQCLDLFFDLVCMTQAAGDDENCAALAYIFFKCFETYARPLRLWMEKGRLEASTDSSFISESRENTDLRTLWHDWYTLDAQANVPKFIRPFAHKIFVTGKGMVFLKRLNTTESLETTKKSVLRFEDIYPSDASSVCLPFYALLESAFSKVVNENHAFTSSLLRTQLNEQCGLWISLQALEHIHLCKDISLVGPIDTKIFELIDRGKGGWSDRYLLTEFAQTAFGALPFIDPTRLIVRSGQNSDNRSRSVKILSSLSFDYILPWPVANIITKEGIAAYQRISTLLMQVRRAKYTIVKQRSQCSHYDADEGTNSRGQTLSFGIRHNLLWFLNVLYAHLTSFVISAATESLRKSLSTAHDVDGMIAAHRSYMTSLEEQCLLSKNLQALHQATLSLLDLCIFFADLQASWFQNLRHTQTHTDPAKTPRKQVPGKPFKTDLKPTLRKTRYEYSYGDEGSESDDLDESDSQSDEDQDEDGKDALLRRHRSSSQSESHYVQQLKNIQDQFNHLVGFLTAGLKGVGRVDGQVSWEMLAEKLEWRKERALGLS